MSKSSTLLSSFSARLLMLDMRTSSYPRKLSRMNLERELPKHALLTGSRTSISASKVPSEANPKVLNHGEGPN